MKIFVINLKRSTTRKTLMENQLAPLGVEYEFLEAIDGENLEQKWITQATTSNLYKQINGLYGFYSSNEIACYASHYTAWQKCIELNQPIIILEDDIIITDKFKSSLNLIEKFTRKLDYIRLMVLEKHQPKKIILENLWLYTHCPSGTQGYAITPAGAQKFINHSKKFYSPVDMYMDKWYVHGLRAYCINPEVIAENNSCNSDIGFREKRYLPKPRGFTKIIRELVRPLQQIRNFFYNRICPPIKAHNLDQA